LVRRHDWGHPVAGGTRGAAGRLGALAVGPPGAVWGLCGTALQPARLLTPIPRQQSVEGDDENPFIFPIHRPTGCYMWLHVGLRKEKVRRAFAMLICIGYTGNASLLIFV